MAVGWTRDGSVQGQIDASVKDAVKLARSRLPDGEGATHCEECETVIPDARRKAIPGVRLCIRCQSELEKRQTNPTSKRSLNKAYGRSGLENLAGEEKIPLNFNTGVKKLDIPKGKRLQRSPICEYVLNADKIIAPPKLKTHSLFWESNLWAYRHSKWIKFVVCGLRGMIIRSMDPRMLPIKDSDYQARPIIFYPAKNLQEP
jgi:phage/conjugal plasmid C-4 type zinc finger TraR family protein